MTSFLCYFDVLPGLQLNEKLVLYTQYQTINFMELSIDSLQQPLRTCMKDLQSRHPPTSSLYMHFPSISCAFQFLNLEHLSSLQQTHPENYEALPNAIKTHNADKILDLYMLYLEHKEDIEKALAGNFVNLNPDEMGETELEKVEYKEGEAILGKVNERNWEGREGRVRILIDGAKEDDPAATVLAVYDYQQEDSELEEQGVHQEAVGNVAPQLQVQTAVDDDQNQQDDEQQSQEYQFQDIANQFGWCHSCLRKQILDAGGVCWSCFQKGRHLPIFKYGEPIAFGVICYVLTMGSLMLYDC